MPVRTQRLKVRTLGAVDRRVATGAMEQPSGVGRGKGRLPRGAADGRTLTQRWSPEGRIHSHEGSEGRGGPARARDPEKDQVPDFCKEKRLRKERSSAPQDRSCEDRTASSVYSRGPASTQHRGSGRPSHPDRPKGPSLLARAAVTGPQTPH